MEHSIRSVAVIGAGTMGAAIAAHVANAGLPVLLLDIPPRELDAKEKAKGLDLEHPAVRNRIVRQGLERCRKLKPASFMSRRAEALVRLGNTEDDLEQLAEADWIVEAVVEKLDIKRQLMTRIDAVRHEDAVVTTNTSGLPIASIAEGLSDGFRSHFFGTHFFNPPRYMHLVEIIRGLEADPLVVSSLAEFIGNQLGKGVVFCKDTPNFIANRLLAVHGSFVIEHALAGGYRFEEVDQLTGPLIGRPKTATFRLQDLVGIDVAYYVNQNLYENIEKDPYTEVLRAPRITRLIEQMLEKGRLGNKAGHGFYRRGKGPRGKPIFEVLDPETFDYGPQVEPDLPAVAAVAKIGDLGERLRTLLAEENAGDRGVDFVWRVLTHYFGYVADIAEHVAYDLPSIDRAIRWGFGYEIGPFELWDLLGVEETADRLEASGVEVAEWVKEMLFAEIGSFYRREDGWVTGYYDWNGKQYVDLLYDEHHIRVEDLAKLEEPQASNESASLHNLGDGVLLLEFHSKMNAIDAGIIEMLERAALELAEGDQFGLVIGNDGPNFCVGANLVEVVTAAGAGDIESVRAMTDRLQKALQALRYGPKPVVAAVHGMALGGGAEVALGCDRIVAHAESYIGLVEAGVGLLPAGGGLKELVRRTLGPVMAADPGADPLPLANGLLETVAMAKTSTSAAEARELGFLGEADVIVMHRDRLLHEAKRQVLAMAEGGYLPPAPLRLWAGGRDLLAALEIAVWSLAQAGFASEHDALVARKVARVISGGDGSAPEWLDEQHFLDLEGDAFAALVATEKTQERIQHTLKTGKPLRN